MEVDSEDFKALKLTCECHKEEITHLYQLIMFRESRGQISQKKGVDFLFEAFEKVGVTKENKKLIDSFKVQLANEDYHNSMTSKTKGTCLVINNVAFTSDGPGSDHDAGGLSPEFTKLSFRVEMHKNLSSQGIISTLQDILQRDHGCVSHCSLSSVFGTDDIAADIQSLLDMFSDRSRPSLEDKSKVFFFQACQGQNYERNRLHDKNQQKWQESHCTQAKNENVAEKIEENHHTLGYSEYSQPTDKKQHIQTQNAWKEKKGTKLHITVKEVANRPHFKKKSIMRILSISLRRKGFTENKTAQEANTESRHNEVYNEFHHERKHQIEYKVVPQSEEPLRKTENWSGLKGFSKGEQSFSVDEMHRGAHLRDHSLTSQEYHTENLPLQLESEAIAQYSGFQSLKRFSDQIQFSDSSHGAQVIPSLSECRNEGNILFHMRLSERQTKSCFSAESKRDRNNEVITSVDDPLCTDTLKHEDKTPWLLMQNEREETRGEGNTSMLEVEEHTLQICNEEKLQVFRNFKTSNVNFMVRTQKGDRMLKYTTSTGEIYDIEERKGILMQHVNNYFSLQRKIQQYEILKCEARRKLLSQMVKSFFDCLYQSVLAACIDTNQTDPFCLQHDACRSLPKQQVITVYMIQATVQFPRDPQKPLSADESKLNNSEMCKELVRYGTFESWPNRATAWPNRLASAGFYYTGHGDEVICYSCGVTHSGWRPGMAPMEVHSRLSPSCSFITHQAGNIPIVEDQHAKARLMQINGQQPAPSLAYNSSGYYSMPVQTHPEVSETQQRSASSLSTNVAPASGPGFPSLPVPNSQRQQTSATPSGQPFMPSQASSTTINNGQQSSMAHREIAQSAAQSSSTAPRRVMSDYSGTLGINTDKPQYPNHAVTASRLSTFNAGWPQSHKQTPRELAEAGFFYSGNGDSVRCFFCGTGLRNWDTGDNPWVEHARWSPQCVYLKQHQGPAFVTLVQDLSSGGSQVDYRQVLDILQDMEGNSQTPAHDQAAESSDRVNIRSSGADGDSNNSVVSDQQDDSLVEENERLKQQTLCKICLDKEVTIVFLPCGHLVCCAECAPALRKCPMCRTDVKGTVRAYMG